jgi:hypothetical protein
MTLTKIGTTLLLAVGLQIVLFAIPLPVGNSFEAQAASAEAVRRAQCIRHPNLPQCKRR